VREDAPEFFTVASTVCEIFAAKECNSPQRCANPTPLNHLASATDSNGRTIWIACDAHQNMSAEIKKEIQLEIAHVLFIDIVGYSKAFDYLDELDIGLNNRNNRFLI